MLILAAIDATWLRLILIVQTSKRLTPCCVFFPASLVPFLKGTVSRWPETLM